MPRTKQPHTPPTLPKTSLDGFSIAFTDPKRPSIPLHHTDLANKTFTQLEDEIERCGGSVVNKIETGKCTHVVATPEQHQKNEARIKDATKHNIPVVSYDWLAASLDSQNLVDEASFTFSAPQASAPAPTTNGTQVNAQPTKRARDEDGEYETDAKKLKISPNGSAPSQKPKLKVPVDEHYPEKRCQVYQDDHGVYFDANLNQTDSGKNANRFYRVQLLQHNDGEYYTWTRWGRVGDDPGRSKVLGSGNLRSALSEFSKKFKDKTGLIWDDRDAAPKTKKYIMIEINYEESDDGDQLPGTAPRRGSKESLSGSASSESVESKLTEPVARLMSLIFNNDFFNSTLADLDYDADKMPLRKLSKKTLLQGYEVLKELAGLIGIAGPAPAGQELISTLSDQYHSLIPHAYGRTHRPPVFGNMDMVKKEVTLLENLTDMRLTNEIMKTAKNNKAKPDEKIALVDRQYLGLGMQEMTPLAPNTTEYKELADYLVKSAGKSHYIQYQVQDIFRIERRGEFYRFKNSKFAKLEEGKSDRRLLWHGSRTTNFGGILSQGLRIAPPEAPASGYMYGRGIYLANISTKSAGYCAHYSSANTGLLLLCEAELGNPPLRLTNAAYDASEQAKEKGCISTFGVGMTTPRGWRDAGCVHPDLKGVNMPDVSKEPARSNEANLYLLYDEFVCYAVEQVRLRYLLRVQMTERY